MSWSMAPSPTPQVPLHRAHEHTDHGPAEIVVPRQQIAHAIRQAQHPLPHGHVGQHVVHQVRGAFGHAPAATAGAEPSPLARERNQAVGTAPVTAEAREAGGQPAAAQERPEFLLDEPRQPLAVVPAGRLNAERLEVIPNDGVERAPTRVARGVRGHVHPTDVRRSHATRVHEHRPRKH